MLEKGCAIVEKPFYVCQGLHSLRKESSMKGQEQQNLAAPCGLYCGACSAYVAGRRGDTGRLEDLAKRVAQYRGQEIETKDIACEGCLSSGVIALYCRDCVLRACAFEKGLTHCAQCSDFPCQPIIDFNNDGIRHHSEVLDNIRRQREMSIDAWVEEQEQRWRCPQCGCAVDWYARQCPDCDTVLPRRF